MDLERSMCSVRLCSLCLFVWFCFISSVSPVGAMTVYNTNHKAGSLAMKFIKQEIILKAMMCVQIRTCARPREYEQQSFSAFGKKHIVKIWRLFLAFYTAQFYSNTALHLM